MTAEVQIICYADAVARNAGLDDALESLLFATSATRDFKDNGAREAFRHRWLDRYLYRYTGDLFVALNTDRTLAGYLAGCTDDAALIPAFADIPYLAAFKEPCARFPAHLHVNVSDAWRGQGIGRRLIEAFASGCREKHIAALHAVTASDAPAVAFFRRCGFEEVAKREVDGRSLVMLGRRANPTYVFVSPAPAS